MTADADGDHSDATLRSTRARRVDEAILEAFTAGWVFFVPLPAFRSAMDITREDRRERAKYGSGSPPIVRQVWSQGNPPAFSFSVGDMFHAPVIMDGQGPRRLLEPEHSIQVQAVANEHIEIEIIDYPAWTRRRVLLTQAELGKLLRDGDLSGMKTVPSSQSQAFTSVMLGQT